MIDYTLNYFPCHIFLHLVYKFDVTTFDPSPLVGFNGAEEYRTYLPCDERNVTFDKIGRYEDTGTGEVGSGHQNPQDEDSFVPLGSGFPVNTQTDIVSSFGNHVSLHVKFPESSNSERIGVFLFYREQRREHAHDTNNQGVGSR